MSYVHVWIFCWREFTPAEIRELGWPVICTPVPATELTPTHTYTVTVLTREQLSNAIVRRGQAMAALVFLSAGVVVTIAMYGSSVCRGSYCAV
eukprot:gene31074-37556_t